MSAVVLVMLVGAFLGVTYLVPVTVLVAGTRYVRVCEGSPVDGTHKAVTRRKPSTTTAPSSAMV